MRPSPTISNLDHFLEILELTRDLSQDEFNAVMEELSADNLGLYASQLNNLRKHNVEDVFLIPKIIEDLEYYGSRDCLNSLNTLSEASSILAEIVQAIRPISRTKKVYTREQLIEVLSQLYISYISDKEQSPRKAETMLKELISKYLKVDYKQFLFFCLEHGLISQITRRELSLDWEDIIHEITFNPDTDPKEVLWIIFDLLINWSGTPNYHAFPK